MTAIKVDLYKVKEVALKLSLSEWEIRRLCEIGVLHRRYIGAGGRFYRITAQSIDNYLDSLSEVPGE